MFYSALNSKLISIISSLINQELYWKRLKSILLGVVKTPRWPHHLIWRELTPKKLKFRFIILNFYLRQIPLIFLDFFSFYYLTLFLKFWFLNWLLLFNFYSFGLGLLLIFKFCYFSFSSVHFDNSLCCWFVQTQFLTSILDFHFLDMDLMNKDSSGLKFAKMYLKVYFLVCSLFFLFGITLKHIIF